MSELTKALCAARLETSGVVFKGGTNKHQGYAFVGHEHVIRHGGREVMAKHGLNLMLTDIELVQTDVPAGKIVAQLWRGMFQLKHVSGEVENLRYVATVQGNDKCAFVATTSLERVAIQRVLMLSGSSDEDVEHYENTDSPTFKAPEPPPLDPLITKLLDGLYLATPTTIDALLDQARGVFRSCRPDEREAVGKAVEHAKARVAKTLEAQRAEAALAGGDKVAS